MRLHVCLAELYVDPDRQDQGAGTRFMRSLEVRIAAAGVVAISRTTEGEAVRFYARVGCDAQPSWIALTMNSDRTDTSMFAEQGGIVTASNHHAQCISVDGRHDQPG